MDFQRNGSFEVVTLDARIGATKVHFEGICLDRREAVALLMTHPSPTDEHRILREEYGGTTDGAGQDTTWQQKVREGPVFRPSAASSAAVMVTLRRFVCRIFGHTTLPGVRTEWSFLHYRPRCAQLVEGRLARR